MPSPSLLAMLDEMSNNSLVDRSPAVAKAEALVQIARAAKVYRDAERAFYDSLYPSDAMTEAVATAACELEMLLEKHKDLY